MRAKTKYWKLIPLENYYYKQYKNILSDRHIIEINHNRYIIKLYISKEISDPFFTSNVYEYISSLQFNNLQNLYKTRNKLILLPLDQVLLYFKIGII
jgi:hypothetical protein